MKNKDRYRYELVMNKEEFNILETLREEHAVNISKCFKIFLKHYLVKLENCNVNPSSIN